MTGNTVSEAFKTTRVSARITRVSNLDGGGPDGADGVGRQAGEGAPDGPASSCGGNPQTHRPRLPAPA